MSEKIYALPKDWQLYMAPNKEVVASDFAPTTAAELKSSNYSAIAATVPGCFELDLVAAGLAPDPYFSQNPWKFHTYENRHLWYTTTFSCKTEVNKYTYLRFEGLDTVCEIYINGKLLGKTENMLISHEFCAEGFLRQGENEIVVHIIPPTIYARRFPLTGNTIAQKYNYSALHIRKAAYMYGWDIMPRFVSGGIWKPISIVQKSEERLDEIYLYTTALSSSSPSAYVRFFFSFCTDEDDLSMFTVSINGKCGESEFHKDYRPWHIYENHKIKVENAALWYPRNAGEQNLYDVTVTLTKNGELCDERHLKFGIRTAELERTSTTDENGNGEFVFKINGKKIFCAGTNWVPLDAFPCRQAEFLDRALVMLDDLGCNMVRCWGGNVYERDEFYDFCDEHGILVWQDFGMGCAIYPQSDEFAERIRTEAIHVVKNLRNHSSIVLWAGDNENDLFGGKQMDPNLNRLTREVLPRVIYEHDPLRPYIPSSPYVDEQAFATQRKTSEEHLWGPRDYFKGNYYKNSVCHFASETGYHGCPSPSSVKRFIAPDKVWPFVDGNGTPNDDWICHASEMQGGTSGPYAYRIGLMSSQVKTLFGSLPDNLDDFAKQSQISQAEAKKYFIERFRLSKWRRTGILWWNLIDGWPQFSDAIVDWYGVKKLAYHYIKRSQAPVCLMFDEPHDGTLDLYAVNDTPRDAKLSFTVKNLSTGETVYSGDTTAVADSSVVAASITAPEYGMLYIEWTGDANGSNHYSTQTLGISYDQYIKDITAVGFDEFEGF
jgi:beta-mannosidase